MTYKEFLKHYDYRVLLDECDDLNNIFQLVFTNDCDEFDFHEILNIYSFCKKNKLFFEIGVFHGKLVCRMFNVSEDDISV